ncbi:alpha/beta fold hydrolase [Luethyella okanaganae]|uniref:Alpha/beta fold hydrolase n=1 Tax=Luethyella okanaganae TaxID=69372 RepID=A0ABW1VJG4_9MICO
MTSSPAPSFDTVTSADGTRIAYEATGTGPALVIAAGAFSYRRFSMTLELVALLATDFTVYNYDRRGRGDSGDTQPYSTDREIDDLDAVIGAAGGSAYVWGLSSGAALGLEAAARGSKITRLALYEPPYVVNTDLGRTPAGLVSSIEAALAAGDRSKAVTLFMTKGMGMPGFIAFAMRMTPSWKRLTRLAHTIPYDLALAGKPMTPSGIDGSGWFSVACPVMFMVGTKTAAPLQTASKDAAPLVPGAELRWLPNQSHVFKPAVVAETLKEYFR